MGYGALESAEFFNNPETRCPVVLLLDTSGSMDGERIRELQAGVETLVAELRDDETASQRVELAVVTFGGTPVALDVRTGSGAVPFDAAQAFCIVSEFVTPKLNANYDTQMGEAVRRGISLANDRKAIYKANSIDYYRPWIFLITDGAPTDKGWESAADQAKLEESQKKFSMFAIGVSGADMQVLARFSERRPIMLQGLKFKEFFMWLSKSLSAVGMSNPGDQVPLPPVDWGSVSS